MRFLKHIVYLSITGVLILFASPDARAADESPADIVERVPGILGRPVGLAHMPRCTSVDLAMALAGPGTWTCVHVQIADPDAVVRARKAVDEAGLLNRRIFIDHGSLDCLLPVARSCDLVLLTELKAAELTPELASEVKRVLHPWYGVAVLGDASGNLDGAPLLAWAKTISPDATPLPGDGAWVTARAGSLDGADDWPMWWHGADNNAVSTDTAYALPETVQWTGKPFFSTRLELPIIARGRLFMLWNGDAMDVSPGAPLLPDVKGDGPLLTAQATGSGQRLWARRLSSAAWVQVARSIMVADGDELLVADGNRVLVLDGATGREKRQAPLDCAEVKWMALQDGRLFVLGGSTTESFGHRSEKAVIPFRSSGLSLVVLDRETLEPLWRVDRTPGHDAFDPRSPAVEGSRMFLCTEQDTAECYYVRDGSLLWKAKVGFERLPIQNYEWDRSSRHPVTGYAAEGVYVISGTEMEEAVVLSQDNGSKLWTTPTRGPRQFMPLAFNDLLWNGGAGLDPATGEARKTLGRVDRAGCSRFTASPMGIIGNAGLTYNLAIDSPADTLSAKSSCLAGQLVADGLAWKFPTPCSNCTEWRGFIARASAEKKGLASDRLVVSESSPAPMAPELPGGWHTYRANAARSSSMPVRVPDDAAIGWTFEPVRPDAILSRGGAVLMAAELPPTQPVIAGDRVFIAGGDGAVDALDLSSGKRLWRARTGGRMSSSGTVWRERLFVSSNDGCLYAFALADGRELWRLRVAPQPGRTMVYGQLGSRWPALGNPLVVGGHVIATAGLLDAVDGVWAVAASPGNGQLLWERSDWRAANVNGMLSGAGQLAAVGDEIYFHGGEAPPVAMDPQSGDCRPGYRVPGEEEMREKKMGPRNVQGAWRCAKGQEIGALSDDWIVHGGRRLWTDQAEDGTWRNALSFTPREAGDLAPVLQAQDATLLPSWDREDVLILIDSKRWNGGVLMPKAKLLDMLRKKGQPGTADGRGEVSGFLQHLTLNDEALATWRRQLPHGSTLAGSALAANAALLLTRDRGGAGTLLALARKDGVKLWELPLPGPSVHDGLAIAPDGNMIVALTDGRVLNVGPAKASPARAQTQ